MPVSKIRQAVILAGGRGTRLGALTDHRPKPMVEIGGRPFIEYIVEMLRDAGIERIVFLLGYLSDVVVNHFGDGSAFGVAIDYAISGVDDESGTRLRKARARLDPAFLLLYCDNYWPLDLPALQRTFDGGACRGLLTVYRNTDAYTRDNVRIVDGRIVLYDKSRTSPDLAGVDVGFGIFERDVLDLLPAAGNPSFEATVYPQLVAAGGLASFVTDHRYYSVGSVTRLPLTREFLRRRRTVLVDRDGTLNVRMPRGQYVTTTAEWQWLPGTREALGRLTAAGYRIIVITNQPGVARGALSQADLESIHMLMKAEAAAAGASIDAVLTCMHGWGDGCACRKPEPGMLFEAQRHFSLDLSRTPFIGDDDRDAAAAERAGSPFYRVGSGHALPTIVDHLLEGERSFRNAS
jgi:histidinol-phosphate phosphatase family protein